MNKIYCATYSLATSPGSPVAYRYVYVVAAGLQEVLDVLDTDNPQEEPTSISEITNGAKVLMHGDCLLNVGNSDEEYPF